MTDTISVVKPHYRIEDAYKMGHDRFKAVDVDDPEDFDLAPFKGSAAWANIVAPKLRSMAGFGDRGHGTYKENRKVAAVEPGCEEDEPADAELVDAQHVFQRLVEAFNMGAYDGVEGTFDPDAAKW